MSAILQKLFITFDCNRDEDFGFSFGRRDVKGDIVKIRDYLVNGYGRRSCPQVSSYIDAGVGGEEGYPEKRSVRRDWMSTF